MTRRGWGVLMPVLTTVVLSGATIGCSGSDAPDDDPGIGPIDGPAQVDPSYDPFAVATTNVP